MLLNTTFIPAIGTIPAVKFFELRNSRRNSMTAAGERRGLTTRRTRSTGIAASIPSEQLSGRGAPLKNFFFQTAFLKATSNTKEH